MSGREISRKKKRFKTVINNFLKNPKECAKKKHTDWPHIFTMHWVCPIACRACLKKQSSTQIKTEMNFALAMNECTS